MPLGGLLAFPDSIGVIEGVRRTKSGFYLERNSDLKVLASQNELVANRDDERSSLVKEDIATGKTLVYASNPEGTPHLFAVSEKLSCVLVYARDMRLDWFELSSGQKRVSLDLLGEWPALQVDFVGRYLVVFQDFRFRLVRLDSGGAVVRASLDTALDGLKCVLSRSASTESNGDSLELTCCFDSETQLIKKIKVGL